ncbi:hypothetical protein PGTUg99_008124 [Puccinia graminis f. sp. tritici]|uniref:DUF6589 domain-containing protein n=1 Tax=Puccinia graminis f. sp. tritici TaxID=56615 RepID=A0A5B0PBR8_PUCGR|nr:hypothetical protein PGTUg99_008124 [Puccinia graminis f. sp. tritici]
MVRHTTTARFQRTNRTEMSKLKEICNVIARMNHTPKTFLTSFLTNENGIIAFQRRYWRTKRGWKSTLKLLEAIQGFICKKKDGKARWEQFILDEAVRIVEHQKPPSGAYPNGAYHNTRTITEKLFAPNSKKRRDDELVTDHMPFLFGLIYSKLAGKPGATIDLDSCDDEPEDGKDPDPVPAADLDGNGAYTCDGLDSNIPFDCNHRAYMVAKTVCSMVAFVNNRRNNGHQLANSLTFLACGVTDRVNVFLNYIGLSSSRKTSHHALNNLSRQARLWIAVKISKSIAPTLGSYICFDNLDFEQRIHTKSVGHSSHMFHGTWGYVHHPSPEILESVPPSDLTLESYWQAMSKASTFNVHSKMLLPTPKEEVQWEFVIKSQITSALLEHLATPSDSFVSINTSPPALEPIPSQIPDITMLKLMIASDNSAQGAGEVFNAIVDQSNITMSDFASRVQVIDADLATCTNVTTLRSQRAPSRHKEESLMNVVTILGGAHTLWNVAQAIYSKHIGDTSDSRESGACRFLDGLGIPSKNMLDKKDFTGMIKNIEKIHKASLVHCLM